MVNPGICRRCPHCQGVEGVERDDNGIVSIASVDCALDELSVLIVGDSVVPDGCPYLVEHTVLADKTKEVSEGWSQELEEQEDAARFQR